MSPCFDEEPLHPLPLKVIYVMTNDHHNNCSFVGIALQRTNVHECITKRCIHYSMTAPATSIFTITDVRVLLLSMRNNKRGFLANGCGDAYRAPTEWTSSKGRVLCLRFLTNKTNLSLLNEVLTGLLYFILRLFFT